MLGKRNFQYKEWFNQATDLKKFSSEASAETAKFFKVKNDV